MEFEFRDNMLTINDGKKTYYQEGINMTGADIRKGVPVFLIDHIVFMKAVGRGAIKLTAKHNDYNIWTSYKVDGQEFDLYGYCRLYDCPACGWCADLGGIILHDDKTDHKGVGLT